MLINKTDSYKVSHYLQFPKEMKQSFYYIESRSKGEMLKFFGLQMLLKKYFFDVPTRKEVAKWGKFWEAHGLPFNYEGWNYIADLCYYPLKISAVPEGSLVPSGVPMVTVESTDENVPWLAGWAETTLMQLWYPTTVCTKSWKCKEVIKGYLEDTGDVEGLPFKLHDFGYRGVSSQESAEIGGLAHLVNFMGTDTIPAVIAAYDFYEAEGMPAFSIPASEHSTITSWGEDGEKDAYNNMLDQFAKDGGLFACVSDSYDLSYAVKELWGSQLKDKVKDSGATLVIRPDSGDPVEIVLRTLRECEEVFGMEKNAKGFKVLPSYVKIIQGDGISTPQSIDKILGAMKVERYSADNIAFGMGGGLLQDLNRDTYKFAMKMSAIKRGEEWFDVFKNPKDAPWKASKKGRLELPKGGRVVFNDGVLEVEESLQVIRDRD